MDLPEQRHHTMNSFPCQCKVHNEYIPHASFRFLIIFSSTPTIFGALTHTIFTLIHFTSCPRA